MDRRWNKVLVINVTIFYDTCNGVLKYLLFALVEHKMLGVFFFGVRLNWKMGRDSRLETAAPETNG